VHVCGTRATAADYSPDEGSHLEGLDYAQLDVGDARAIENFRLSFERLDVLVLAQGAVIYRRGEFEMGGFRKVLEVNLISLMACAARFHAMLSAARGSLIIVSSTAAYHATKGNPAYNASKTGAVGLTRTLGQAWAENGIRVNGIAPGLVDTKMTRVTTSNPKRLEGAIERIPLKRLGTPADMAGAALFLASPLAPTSSVKPWSWTAASFCKPQEPDRVSSVSSPANSRSDAMDKDRIVGAAKDVAGKVEGTVGDVAGDPKTQAAGRAREAAGTVQNLYGQAKDAAREVKDTAREATDAAVGYAKDAYENSGDTFREGSQAVAKKVQENPLGALLVAAGIGFALALLMTRPPSRPRGRYYS
jgi:3-oxoacyl-[acyl-carrier protein] reductase